MSIIKKVLRKERDHLTVEEETQLIKEYQETKSEKSLSKLLLAHMNFIYALARKKHNYLSVDYDDLVQEGIIGFINGLNRYDITSGNRLNTYCKFYIESSMYEHILQTSSTIKFSNCKNNRKIFFNIGRYRDSNGKLSEANIKRMVKELDVPETNIREMDSHLKSIFFDPTALAEDGEDSSLSDLYYEPEEALNRFAYMYDESYGLESAVSQIGGRIEDIIRSRYLTDTPVKFTELAEKYGVSHQRIKQLEIDGINFLKNNFKRSDFLSA